MLPSHINLLLDPLEKKELTPHALNSSGKTEDTLLFTSSGNWYPVSSGILELVPPELMYADEVKDFQKKYKKELTALKLKEINFSAKEDVKQQQEQREHYDHFEGKGEVTYDAFEQQPFWRAVDEKVFSTWKDQLKPGDRILDVGCGNGRSIQSLAIEGVEVIGMDLSKTLLKIARQRSKKKGWEKKHSFLIADANELPFKDNSFDYAVTSGVLSQVPNPARTCQEIQRVLKCSGKHFALENNKSIFRKVFDLLGKVFKGWKNVKGNVPECDTEMVKNWLSGYKFQISSYTTVYLPPSIYNIFGNSGAKLLLKLTDGFFKFVPGMKSNGGLIVFEVTKKDQ